MLCSLVPGHMLDHVLAPGGHLTIWLVQIFQLAQFRAGAGQSIQGGFQTKGAYKLAATNVGHCFAWQGYSSLLAMITGISGDGQSRFGAWTGFGSGSAQCG